jgi:PEGA domain
MSETDPDERPGPALDREGNLTGRIQRLELPGSPPGLGEVEAPLELQERPRLEKTLPVERFREAPVLPSRRRGLLLALVAALLAVGLFVAAIFTLRPGGPRPEPTVRSTSELQGLLAPHHVTVVVSSEPDGATVRIAGQVVGTTPWAGDNLWGEAEVLVSLPGYAPWRGRLGRSGDQRLSASLKRR